MNKTKISIAINKEILKVIEEERGLVSRSAYIEDLIRKGLEDSLRDEHHCKTTT